MFNSIFVKYIAAFLIIITLSFITLVFIISAMITGYSIDAKKETMQHTAAAAGQSVKSIYSGNRGDDFGEFIRANSDQISQDLYDYTSFADNSLIFITDGSGEILASSHGMDEFKSARVSASDMDMLRAGSDISQFSTLGDVFGARHLIYPMVLTNGDGEMLGCLFVCSTSAVLNSFVVTATRTIIISCVWVLIATMVVIYFITEKIVAPLGDMSRAAKSFAAGDFKKRVDDTAGDEVGQLASAFNNMAASLEKKEETQRAFLSNVSHDLRTPMTTIAGFVDGILDGTIPPERQEHYLKIISEEVRRLSRLVRSMLDITNIQEGERKFSPVSFDAGETARHVLISFEKSIEDKRLKVEFKAPRGKLHVIADPDAIHQVFYNLIENAIKFSREGGKLEISFGAPDKDKKVRVKVLNEGDGLKEEEIPFVFDRFYKADRSRGLDKTGVGLGLSIVKTIIEAHGEKIWIESKYGEYCAFIFELKAA